MGLLIHFENYGTFKLSMNGNILGVCFPLMGGLIKGEGGGGSGGTSISSRSYRSSHKNTS